MKCLITGISGFLAAYISQKFSDHNFKIIGIHHSLVKPQNRAERCYRIHLPHKDIYKVIEMEKPDVVVHAAGTASVPFSMEHPYTDFSVSVPATAILLDALRRHAPTADFFFLSSAAVYGNPQKLPVTEEATTAPISPYGYHKLMGEELCREYRKIYGLNTIVLRIFSAYGPGLHKQVIYDTVKKFMQQKEVHLYGTGRESRDFIHGQDVANAIYSLSQQSEAELIYNLASGREVTIKELAETVKELMNSDKKITFSGEHEPGKPNNWAADISRIKQAGFSPSISLENGIDSLIQSVQGNSN